MLELKKISYSYNKKNKKISIFEDFDMKIEKGDIVSVVGPSGCGKTTLVNIIAGYIKQTRGEVLMNNKIIIRPGKDRIVINQEDDLFGWMTVYENMKLVVDNEEAIEKFLSLTKLSDYKGFFPSELSGGMKKRLSLARALAVNSEFIIMDEPFVSLDYVLKQELHEELLNIIKFSNKTVLLVTHDVEEAIFLSNKVMILRNNPAETKKEFLVNFSYPRKKEIKETDKFLELKRRILTEY